MAKRVGAATVFLALGGCLLTSWERPQGGENTPPTIVDFSVQPSEDAHAQAITIQRGAPDAFPSFTVDVLDLNNPDALEVLWLQTDPTLLTIPNLQRQFVVGDEPGVRLFQYTFQSFGTPVTGCWKIVASACDGQHLRTNDGCEPGVFEDQQLWYGCVFDVSSTECDMGQCPP